VHSTVSAAFEPFDHAEVDDVIAELGVDDAAQPRS
jgi:hypothetical protein